MVDELEALVGHVHVVDGRHLTMPPPGALVQLAPKRAPRSRQNDAFFILVLPSGERAKAVFYEEMAKLAAERYFQSAGAVTTGLRDVFTGINAQLFAHNAENPGSPFYADVVCLVLRGREVYIAKTGGGLVLLWRGETFETFPYDLKDPDLINGQPLGYAEEPDLKMAHFQVGPEDEVSLSGSGLLSASLDFDALREVGSSRSVAMAVERLKAQQFQDAAIVVMQFVSPEMPDDAVAAPAESAAPTPPDTDAPSPPKTPKKPRQPRQMPAVFKRLGSLLRRGGAESRALVETAAAKAPSLDTLQTGSRNIFLRAAGAVLRLLRGGIVRLMGGIRRLRGVLDKMLPEPEPGKPPSLPTPVAAGAAVVIPIAVVLLVLALSISIQDETAFERCLTQAQEAIGVARLIEENESGDAQEAWFGVMEVVNQCLPRRPEDPALLEIRAEAQARLDVYAGVVRCDMTLLRRFDPGADLRGPVLQNGVDLYTLDVARSILYRDSLSADGNALIREPEIILQRGQAIGEFVVRSVIDIDWLEEGGVARGSALIALDREGVLYSYSPTFPPVAGQALVGADRWIQPVAIATWQGRLYILDPPANQVWRYQPSGGAYPSAPEEYFVGEVRPDLSSAVDIAIDETGNVYILLEDGTLLKYYGGESQFFQFSNLPSGGIGSLGSATGVFLDTGFISPGFYVMDADNQILYETTMGGTFVHSYRAPFGTSFRDLSGVAVDDSAEIMYIAARNMLYTVPKCG